MRAKALCTTVAIFLVSVLLAGCWETGNGEKIGTITRLNKRGAFCQTWEGEIIRGGLNGGSGVMGAAFHFTVESDELAKKVEAAMNAQQEVKITFRSEAISFCRSDSESYFLKSIEPLNQVAMPPTQTPVASPAQSRDRDAMIIELLNQNKLLLEKLIGGK